jgi:glycolate oxidase iron-sulfur subunit
MQTNISQRFLHTRAGEEAEKILRSCVHCGFCTATCPTYQLVGDELDSPRGRIYLIKQFLEGQEVTRRTQHHLDRCLTCRSCETTCPSGVEYGHLVDIGRELIEQELPRPLLQRIPRWMMRKILPFPQRFAVLLRPGQWLRPLLPSVIRKKVPARQRKTARPATAHPRRMIIFEGCAQSVTTPGTNDAAARVLDRLGISLVSPRAQGCCGAVSQHLAAPDEALDFVRRNIDAWWPEIEAGAEAIIVSASGCGAQVADYAHLLRDDPQYAQKAEKVTQLARDLSEIIDAEDLSALTVNTEKRIAFHSPCSLQHGLQLNGKVEGILQRLGFELTAVPDSHLCCGSAGTYSILQAKMSQRLLGNKLEALQSGQPELIATANVGCQMHLDTQADVPVCHWVELLDPMHHN